MQWQFQEQMVGWITDATCIALTSQGMFAFSNKQTKNPDSVYAEGDFLQGKDPNLKTFLLHFLSVYSYLPFCVCEYALYKHEKKKNRDLQQRVDKTTIKKLNFLDLPRPYLQYLQNPWRG